MPTDQFHETPEDIKTLLEHNPELNTKWESLTPLARNEWICWVITVKKEETRIAHRERLQSDLLNGKRRPCCWPGCPHRNPNAKKWFS